MTVIVKTTSACNAGCIYCSAWKEGPGKGARVPVTLVARLLEALAAHAKTRPDEPYTLVWHGGEPLLLGAPFYREVAALTAAVPAHLRGRLRHSVQTNLLALDEPLVEALSALGASIGTSVDPLTATRADARGADYYPAWLDRYTFLRRTAPGLGVGAIFVVHRRALGQAARLYRFFRNLGLDSVRFNPLYLEGRAKGRDDLSVSPEEFGGFLADLADAWDADERSLPVYPLKEFDASIRRDADQGRTCENRGDCATTHLGLSPDGTVWNCGRFADSGQVAFGSLWSDPFDAILDHPERVRLRNRALLLRRGECRDCPWWEACSGGCPGDAWLVHGSTMRKTGWCEARKSIFERLSGTGGGPRVESPGDVAAGAAAADRDGARADRGVRAR